MRVSPEQSGAVAGPLIAVNGLLAGYGRMLVLDQLTLHVDRGEAIALIGHNGTGKSTLLRCLSGQLKPRGGEIVHDGVRIDGSSPDQIVRRGIVQVPAGRRVFPRMSCLENLEAGAFTRTDRAGVRHDIAALLERFPKLAEKRHQNAGVLSGGEQQLLAIARGLMARPLLLMIDEPSLGLSPIMVDQVFDAIVDLVRDGMSVILAEQNVYKALQVTQRAYVLAQGRVATTGESRALLADPEVRRGYLGVDGAAAFGALVEAAGRAVPA